ncbi:FMN-dependent NADH-azoreductase [Bowmanella yangjiangensis]|uniref:FMN dependent NADH:quinone oxidoreductase n=1 Tax=Bowmanella yangjiangensis TaxID=2811230 RepID=A0ABS3CW97_9ALTE|nr:NAD(P)H-dependent oxidoreductase [Bowmanella yangjiangensis]MBN7819894.1 NAD(P)H-dependent oxidoreductase [Bowmanella yangjiangensis]
MKKLLLINTSLNGKQGHSWQLAEKFVDQLAASADINVTLRDLDSLNLPHLSSSEMAAWMTPADERSEQQKELAAISDELVAEIKAHDIIVIGMPMYNFGVPSVFKSWIDRVARAGVTFRYTENGPVGLLENKKVYVVAARGGLYQGTPKDSQTQYLKDVLAFLGMSDVEFVYAEGLNMGPDAANKGFAQADEKISELIEKMVA